MCRGQVIKEVREITKLDLKAAKDLVEAAPKVLVKDLKKDEAEALMKKLKDAGATCELEVLMNALHSARCECFTCMRVSCLLISQ